jgi:hypothetical protein
MATSTYQQLTPQPCKRQLLPNTEVVIPTPKMPPAPPGELNLLTMAAMPVGMALVYGLMALGGRGNILLALPMMLMGLLVPGCDGIAHHQKQNSYEGELLAWEHKYTERLKKCESELSAFTKTQQAILNEDYPPIDKTVERVMRRNNIVWSRQPGDDDFLAVRAATGVMPLCVTVKPPQGDNQEDMLAPLFEKADQIVHKCKTVENVPLCAKASYTPSPHRAPMVQNLPPPKMSSTTL